MTKGKKKKSSKKPNYLPIVVLNNNGQQSKPKKKKIRRKSNFVTNSEIPTLGHKDTVVYIQNYPPHGAQEPLKAALVI
jgi:hypothetical protein